MMKKAYVCAKSVRYNPLICNSLSLFRVIKRQTKLLNSHFSVKTDFHHSHTGLSLCCTKAESKNG